MSKTAPKAAARANTRPFGSKYLTDSECGNVYVKGTYNESLTIGAANDVIVIGNTTTTGGSSGGEPSGTATLGLIATNFVRVYHPVKENAFEAKIETGHLSELKEVTSFTGDHHRWRNRRTRNYLRHYGQNQSTKPLKRSRSNTAAKEAHTTKTRYAVPLRNEKGLRKHLLELQRGKHDESRNRTPFERTVRRRDAKTWSSTRRS